MSRQIDNPQTGEHISFLTTASEGGGELLRMEFRMDPGGFVAAERLHPRQEERFRVLDGAVRFRIEGVERDAVPSDEVVVAAGTPHMRWNAGDQPARVIVELRPALRTQEFFETRFAWVHE